MQRRGLETLGDGDVLVMEARGVDAAGTIGDISAFRAVKLGVAGIVSDGPIRDGDVIATFERSGLRRRPTPLGTEQTARARGRWTSRWTAPGSSSSPATPRRRCRRRPADSPAVADEVALGAPSRNAKSASSRSASRKAKASTASSRWARRGGALRDLVRDEHPA